MCPAQTMVFSAVEPVLLKPAPIGDSTPDKRLVQDCRTLSGLSGMELKYSIPSTLLPPRPAKQSLAIPVSANFSDLHGA
jgi:hypothetical protein